MLLLGIESSCDECSVALVKMDLELPPPHQVKVIHHLIHSQIELHKPYGGVVPEIASRNHLETMNPLLDELLRNAGLNWTDLRDSASPNCLKAVAVTNRPGLVGALLVGVSCAKALAYGLDIPLVPVDHLEGHLHSLFISQSIAPEQLPLLVLLVSGGHTELHLIRNVPPHPLNSICLGRSRDDAAGEAFDKCAKLMGLEYPGGRLIDAQAKQGDAKAFSFPRPRIQNQEGDSHDFSFSGLKTSMSNTMTKLGYTPHIFGDSDAAKLPQGKMLADLCASLQEAIVDTLLIQIKAALESSQAKSFAVVGGVSANSRLRSRTAAEISLPVFFPQLEFCTDNAAMIACAGAYAFLRGEGLTGQYRLNLNAYSSALPKQTPVQTRTP